MQSNRSRVERITLWVGAICGIATAGITIWDKATSPKSSDLDARYVVDMSNFLRIVPDQKSIKDSGVVDLPVQIEVRNVGGRTAKNVHVSIIHTRASEFRSRSLKISTVPLLRENGTLSLSEIIVGDLHPHSTIVLDDSISITLNKPDFIPRKDWQPLKDGMSHAAYYEDFTVSVSSDGVAEKVRDMHLVVGSEKTLQESAEGAEPFYVVDQGEMMRRN